MTEIAVIVPAFNVEQYIERCIRSLLKQTFSDIEIIIVDDGSTDATGELCDKIAEQNDTVTVIHQINQGISAARNRGPEWIKKYSKCNLIGFVDSDDWVHPQMYEILYRNAIRGGVLVSACKFKSVYKEEAESFIENNYPYEIKDGLTTAFSSTSEATVVWNKLYNRKIFEENKLLFSIGKIHEDELLSYKLLYHANKLVWCNIELYYYYQREGSIMHSMNALREIQIIDAFEEQYRFTRQIKRKDLYAKTAERLLWAYKSNYGLLAEERNKYQQQMRMIKHKFIAVQAKHLYDVPLQLDEHYWFYKELFPKVFPVFHRIYSKLESEKFL